MALNWRGAWNTGSTYQVDDVVFYLTASYVALDINTNTAPAGSNIGVSWGTFAIGATGAQGAQGTIGNIGPVGETGAQGETGATGATGQGFTWRNAYSSTVTYNAYDCVSYNNSSYICIAAGVANITPGTDGTKWNLLISAGTLPMYSLNETPTGLINSSNREYTLANSPVTDTLMVFLNGSLIDDATYTLASNMVTFNAAPTTGKMRVLYQY